MKQRIQAGSWGLVEQRQESVSSNQMLQWVSQVWFPTADGTVSHSFWGRGMTANWDGTKLFLRIAGIASKLPVTGHPWSVGPDECCDIEFCSSLTLSLISSTCLLWLSSHLSKLHKQVFARKHNWVMVILVKKNLSLDNPGQECTRKSSLFVIFFLHCAFV